MTGGRGEGNSHGLYPPRMSVLSGRRQQGRGEGVRCLVAEPVKEGLTIAHGLHSLGTLGLSLAGAGTSATVNSIGGEGRGLWEV